MAGSANDIAQLVVHSKKHLKLVGGGWKLEVPDNPEGLPDHQLVVSGDSYIGSVPEKFFENVTVIAIDDPHVPIGDCTGLHVDTFAQAVVRLEIFECRDIVDCAPQVRLNHYPDIRVFPAQFTING